MNSKLLLSLLCVPCLPWFTLPAAAQRGAAKAPAGAEKHIYKTVGEVQLPLYVFSPKLKKSDGELPAIVFFFGGGWKAGSPTQFEEHCKYLAGRGMVAVTVEYRVTSRHKVKVEDCIADARSAMRWVRGNAKKLGIDPNRIASGGGSAGGHLGAMVALTDAFDATNEDKKISAEPNAMVLFNPALAIAPDEKHLPAAYNEQFKTRAADRAHGPIQKVSPLTYAAKKQPPCIMFFGTADRLLIGAEAYRKVSAGAGNRCEIATWEGQGHGFFNVAKEGGKFYKLTVAEMDKFLVSLGYLNGKAKEDSPSP